jgi:hypothetical protein
VSIDEQHVALPKLYGAPAYARPEPVVVIGPRPFDPDDLPIEAFQTDDERELASSLPARAWAPGGVVIDTYDQARANGHNGTSDHGDRLRPRPLRLRSIAGRLLGGD